MDKIREFIEKYGIHVFHMCRGSKSSIYTDTDDIDRLLAIWNVNFFLIIIGENCFVIPKLCAIRWRYFLTSPKYSDDCPYGILHIDIGHILVDSGVLENINYYSFPETFIRMIQNNNVYNVLYNDREIEQWRVFMDLLIPPNNYWTNFDYETPETFIPLVTSTASPSYV